MRKLKLLIPILLVLSLLFVSCAPEEDEPVTYDTITLDEAAAAFESDGDEFKSYRLELTVRNVKDESYGELSAFDATGAISVSMLYMKGENGARIEFSDFATPVDAGDKIIIDANLKLGDNGKLTVWRAELLSVTKGELKEDEIIDIRELEDGTEVTVDGVVAAKTYAFGMKPSGIILVDGTSSIYIYSSEIAEAVSVGNTITVSGNIAHWILEDEQANAAKHGYKGSCQIESATLVDNNGGTSDFNKSWIEELSVKELVDIPVTENITTKLYKVTALIKEVPGGGFTNYYFFDLDGSTGTYAYTQCDGADFEWLRAYDGKFCTVYITALNAKSTSSDCFFRFLPVAVVDEDFTFDPADAPEYAVKYHGMTQLKGEYSGDPALNLISSVSSELLGFAGVTLEYTSSNDSIIKFTVGEGFVTMNCPGFGTATVTVTARLGGYSYSETIDITVEENDEIHSVSVADAIASAVDEVVTVKGIVGPSFVHANNRGFYLMGENEVIAVSFLSVDTLKDISIGNTVIIRGTRSAVKETQIAVMDAELLANAYGEAELPAGAITDGVAINAVASTENTTGLYRVTATVGFNVSPYSTTYDLSGVQLYSSNAPTQYSIIADKEGETVTAIVSVVNWNGKGYKLTLVAIETADGVLYNEYSFDMAK